MATSLTTKLQLKAGQNLIVKNAPRGMRTVLEGALIGISITAAKRADAILLFVNDRKEAEVLIPDALGSVDDDGLVWIAYPKGTSSTGSDLNRDKLRDLLEPQGWDTVRIIALDETWSALRFRPHAKVGR
jgi:hypothetical protein